MTFLCGHFQFTGTVKVKFDLGHLRCAVCINTKKITCKYKCEGHTPAKALKHNNGQLSCSSGVNVDSIIQTYQECEQ